jgi:putative DNA primase/helicase
VSAAERARGRWLDILPRLGVDPRFLVNRHGPCPICGGKDRWRFDDKGGSGSFYCNQCGPGTGLTLLRRIHRWDFPTACREVERIIATSPPPAQQPDPGKPAVGVARIQAMLAEATDRTIVERYLRGRGLRGAPSVLLGHPALPAFDDNRFIGRFPAMLAPVVGPNAELRSVHRTYLMPTGRLKKLVSPIGRGAAVRLFEPTDELAVAEGIETAIAGSEMFGLPTWATLGTAGLESFEPPETIGRLTVLGDADPAFAGQKAAYSLAQRLARERRNLHVVVLIPPEPGSDWLDVLTGSAPSGPA